MVLIPVVDDNGQLTGEVMLKNCGNKRYEGIIVADGDAKNYRSGVFKKEEMVLDMNSRVTHSGNFVGNLDAEFEAERKANKLKLMLARATASPMQKSLNGWNLDLYPEDGGDDINNRYNSKFNRQCSRDQERQRRGY